jgi:hypothetical protein
VILLFYALFRNSTEIRNKWILIFEFGCCKLSLLYVLKIKAVKYILSQEEHHKKQPFKEEYLEMLEKNDVAFNQEYLFEFFSNIYE